MPRTKAEPKDPNAPKRPLNAFFLFCKDERGRVKEEHKEFKASEVTKELGRRWQEVDAATKQKYESMVAKEKARYDKEMNAYKNKGKSAAQGGDDDDDDDDGDY